MVTQARFTLNDFLAIPGIDERRLELLDGEVREKVSPVFEHGELALELGAELRRFGRASVEARAIIPASSTRGPASPLPDISFFRRGTLRGGGWMTKPPHVAVEIVSHGQSRMEMRAKADLYLEFGVESVWVVYPGERVIDVYEGGGRRTLAEADTLESGAVPGLSLSLASLFRVLDDEEES